MGQEEDPLEPRGFNRVDSVPAVSSHTWVNPTRGQLTTTSGLSAQECGLDLSTWGHVLGEQCAGSHLSTPLHSVGEED